LVKDIQVLAEKEVAELKDMIAQDESQGETEAWVKQNGWTLDSSNLDAITLTRKEGRVTVRVTFSGRDEMEPTDEEQQEEGQEGGPEKEDEMDTTKGISKALEAEVEWVGDDGKPAAVWAISAFSGGDDVLYLNTMEINDKPGEERYVPPITEFDTMSPDLQEKLVEMLASLGIDDELGQFAKTYHMLTKAKSDVQFLEIFRKVLQLPAK